MGGLGNQVPQPTPPGIQFLSTLKYVSHRRAKYTIPNALAPSILVPKFRLPPVFVSEETAVRSGAPDLLTNTLRPRFRVTMLACWGNLRASPPRIKSVIGPLDL